MNLGEVDATGNRESQLRTEFVGSTESRPTSGKFLLNAATRHRRLNHHQLGDVLGREQTDQALHAVEHWHSRAVAFLHDAERFFETRSSRDGRNVAPHDIAYVKRRIVLPQRRDQIVPCEHTGDVSRLVNHWKIVLGGREESVHSFLQRSIFRKRAEFAYHRAGDRKTARDIFHLRESRLLRSADVNEKRDKNQKRIPNQPDESENERKTLANRGSYLCGARITHPGCEKRAQDPATIHGKCREQIESNQQDVNDQQLGNEADPFGCARINKRIIE